MSFCAEPFNLAEGPEQWRGAQGKLREVKNPYDQACKCIVLGILTLRVRCHRGAEGLLRMIFHNVTFSNKRGGGLPPWATTRINEAKSYNVRSF